MAREARRDSPRRLRSWCPCCCVLLLRLAAAQGPVPGIQSAEPLLPPAPLLPKSGHISDDQVLTPNAPIKVRVGIGKATYLRYSCLSGPADVVITLYTYEENSDPLLLLSVDPNDIPNLQENKAVSEHQWREDAPGTHSVLARAVGPNGGVVGVLNTRYFAGEVLSAVLSVRCAAIVAFDALFWDHLRSKSVCPVGRLSQASVAGTTAPGAGVFCSGRGRCERYGVCGCDGAFTGPACEHGQADLVVQSSGRYSNFEIPTGKYQYFRVRVPPDFAGGFLRVSVASDVPLVVLAQMDSLPTKSAFATSNFDDWLQQKSRSSVTLRVPAGGEAPASAHVSLVPGAAGSTVSRRLQESPNSTEARLLQAVGSPSSGSDVLCPQLAASSEPACQGKGYVECEDCCRRCVECPGGPSDESCRDACSLCSSAWCSEKLMACAAGESCRGPRASQCKSQCGGCMACLDSNDARCSNCGCCSSCFPLGAKCGLSRRAGQRREYAPYAYVGVYNHRRYYNDNSSAMADVNISLVPARSAPGDSEKASISWIGNLYNPFHDLRNLAMMQRDRYPEGERFLYDIDVRTATGKPIEVRIFRDRLTLLHIENVPLGSTVQVSFGHGNITHVMTSGKAAPKTFFDFDMVYGAPLLDRGLKLAGGPKLWCAIFGGRDGVVEVTAKVGVIDSGAILVPPPASATNPGAALQPGDGSSSGSSLIWVLAVCCCCMVYCGTSGGAGRKLHERLSTDDPSAPLSSRITELLSGRRPHESTASLTRAQSLSNYHGDDVDPGVEAEYLNRTNYGDDGI